MDPTTASYSPARPVCPSCGVGASLGLAQCESCGATLPNPCPGVGEPAPNCYWVAVKCHFDCRICGHSSPLNHLDLDGSVWCANCGIEQRFATSQWSPLLDFAEAVGDLAGPNRAGRFPERSPSIASVNPFAHLGVSQSFGQLRRQAAPNAPAGESHALTLAAAPGHPLCSSCHALFTLTQLDEQGFSLSCPSCQKQQRYQRPPGLSGNLRGVLAHEHLVGSSAATLEQDPGGAVLIKCPNCKAPLSPDESSAIVTCRYCSAVSRLTLGQRRTLGQKNLAPELWWLLFSGPSRQRLEFERALLQSTEAAENPELPPSKSKSGCVLAIVLAVSGLLVAVGLAVAPDDDPPKPSAAPPQPAQEVHRAADVVPAAPASPEPATPTPAQPEAPSLSLTWTARLLKATGKVSIKGRSCELGLRTAGRSVNQSWVSCGETVLYDSRQSFSGFGSFHEDLLETLTPKGDGFAYLYNCSDVGQRHGRPNLVAQTEQRVLQVFDDNPGGFRVELSVNPLSQPRKGEPLYASALDPKPIRMPLVVTEASQGAPVTQGQKCSLSVALFAIGKKGPNCKVSLKCQNKTLYDTQKPGFWSPCTLDEQGKPLEVTDRSPTSVDSDPMLGGTLPEKSFTLTDDPPKGSYSVSLKGKP